MDVSRFQVSKVLTQVIVEGYQVEMIQTYCRYVKVDVVSLLVVLLEICERCSMNHTNNFVNRTQDGQANTRYNRKLRSWYFFLIKN